MAPEAHERIRLVDEAVENASVNALLALDHQRNPADFVVSWAALEHVARDDREVTALDLESLGVVDHYLVHALDLGQLVLEVPRLLGRHHDLLQHLVLPLQ